MSGERDLARGLGRETLIEMAKLLLKELGSAAASDERVFEAGSKRAGAVRRDDNLAADLRFDSVRETAWSKAKAPLVHQEDEADGGFYADLAHDASRHGDEAPSLRRGGDADRMGSFDPVRAATEDGDEGKRGKQGYFFDSELRAHLEIAPSADDFYKRPRKMLPPGQRGEGLRHKTVFGESFVCDSEHEDSENIVITEPKGLSQSALPEMLSDYICRDARRYDGGFERY